MTDRPTDEDLRRILSSQGGPNLPAATRETTKAMAGELLGLRARAPIALELGALRLHVGGADEALRFAGGLLRHLNAGEVSDLLGVSEKAVRRWRKDGALPPLDGRHQTSLLELLAWTSHPHAMAVDARTLDVEGVVAQLKAQREDLS